MAQRIFRSDDTSSWTYKYGDGSNGTKTYNATHQLDSTDSFYNGTFTGTANATTGTTSIADGTYNLPCVIHQSIGTGANANPNYEFNFLISISGGTATFALPLTLTYNSGAQIVTAAQWSTLTIGSSGSITPPAWDGSKGGILLFFVNGTFSNQGVFHVNSLGFRGGSSVGNSQQGWTGEGTVGASIQNQQTSNGNAGGGGGWSDNNPWNQGNGGGGGVNSTTNAQNGTGTGGGNNVHGAAGNMGTQIGNANLTILTFGGAGGSGGNSNGGSGGSGAGGNGAGIIIVVAKTYTESGSGNFDAIGGNGGTANYTVGCGGSGAGGSALFKCQVATFNGGSEAIGGPHIRNNNHSGVDGDSDGGSGGDGICALDYSLSVTGSLASPTLTTRQDSTLADAVNNRKPLAFFMM